MSYLFDTETEEILDLMCEDESCTVCRLIQEDLRAIAERLYKHNLAMKETE